MQTINKSISLFMSPNVGGLLKVLIALNCRFNYSFESMNLHAELLKVQ